MSRQACHVLCSLLLLIVSAAAAGDVDYDEEDNVIVLTPDNFDSALQDLSPIFVEFCERSQIIAYRFRPDFA